MPREGNHAVRAGACGRCLVCACGLPSPASAAEPKQGGILRVYHRDSPGSASIHEGATYSVNVPFMPVYNNLVVYDQNVAQNSMDSIVPDLAGELDLEPRRQDPDLQAQARRQMA